MVTQNTNYLISKLFADITILGKHPLFMRISPFLLIETILILLSNPKNMKNNFTRTATVILACSLLFASCKKDKDKDNTPTGKTKTELISTGTWKFSTATVNSVSVAGFLQSCQKDNTMTFAANGTGTIAEGASKCNSGDPDTQPFDWNFASSETILHVSAVFFSGGSNDFNIVEISETKLVGSQTIEMSGPKTVIVTFVH